MKKIITKTSIDTSVSIANELEALKQHPKVQEYLLLQKKQSTFGSLVRTMLKDFVHVQGIKQPKAIVRLIEDWSDNAQFVMSKTDDDNKFILNGLKPKSVVGVTVVPTRPTDANFRVMRSYPKVQS